MKCVYTCSGYIAILFHLFIFVLKMTNVYEMHKMGSIRRTSFFIAGIGTLLLMSFRWDKKKSTRDKPQR